MTGRVDDEKTRDLVLEAVVLVDNRRLLLQSIHREVSGTNLLCDTSSLALLDVRLTNLCRTSQLSSNK